MGPLIRVVFPRWLQHVARSLKPLSTARFFKGPRTGRTKPETFAHLSSKDHTTRLDHQEKAVHFAASPPNLTSEDSTGDDSMTPVDEKAIHTQSQGTGIV